MLAIFRSREGRPTPPSLVNFQLAYQSLRREPNPFQEVRYRCRWSKRWIARTGLADITDQSGSGVTVTFNP